MYAHVVLSAASSFFDKPFVYNIPPEFLNSAKIGMQVKVPFGKRTAIGYIIDVSERAPEGIKGIKDIKEIRGNLPFFSEQNARAVAWLSKYYVSFLGSALKTVLPPGISNFERQKGKKRLMPAGPVQTSVNIKDAEAPKELTARLLDLIRENAPAALVLKDGASSDDIYLDLAKHLLSKNKGLILLYPDAEYLIPAIKLFKDSLGTAVGVLHSSMPEKDRLGEWLRVYSGEARIVLGTRSALFAPVKDPGMIIVDREEGYAYKQETSPKYNAREAALFVGKNFGIPVVFVSSCPTPETYHRAGSGEFKMLVEKTIPRENGTLPDIVDMNNEKRPYAGIFSRQLMDDLEDILPKKGKALLIAGRKGHSTFLYCADCGIPVTCPNCSIPLVYSMDDKKVSCGKCGFSSGTSIVCSNCLGNRIRYAGSGTQKIESEIKKRFPFVDTLRIDRDSVTKGEISSTVKRGFSERNAGVLIGTRLASKAAEMMDFDLIAVLSADSALRSGEFRSAEETFRLLSDLSFSRCGKIIVQTYNPGHYAFKYGASLDHEGFYEKELAQRRESKDPPFGNLIRVAVSGRDHSASESLAEMISQRLRGFPDVKVLGPAQGIDAKVRGMNRWHILIKGDDLDIIKAELSGIIKGQKDRRAVISVDVDPIE